VRARWVAGAIAVLFAVSGCATAVEGRPEPASGSLPSGAAASTTACRTSDLMSCIVAAPEGARSYTTPLGPNGTVTTRQFLAAFYPDDAQYHNQIANQLQDEGLLAVAHRNWEVTGGDEIDIVLLGFASASGAKDRAQLVEESTRQDPTLTVFHGAGMPDGVVALVDRAVDKYGNIGVRAYAAYGQVEMEFNYFRPRSLDDADLVAQVGREVRLLKG
jgi:hypothetical protein